MAESSRPLCLRCASPLWERLGYAVNPIGAPRFEFEDAVPTRDSTSTLVSALGRYWSGLRRVFGMGLATPAVASDVPPLCQEVVA